MTLDEKKAIQTVLLKELAEQQQTNPTLLLDALLSGQGYQFVFQVVAKHHALSQQLTAMTTQLLTALKATPADEEAA